MVDATCPFVARAHRAVRDFAARGVPVVVVGRPEHAEVRGVMGACDGARVVSTPEEVAALPFPDGPVGVVCQTTLSSGTVRTVLDALRARYPHLETPPAADVCTATRDRQRAVADFVRGGGDGVLVLGMRRGRGRLRRYVRLISRAYAASASRRAHPPPRISSDVPSPRSMDSGRVRVSERLIFLNFPPCVDGEGLIYYLPFSRHQVRA